MRYLLGVSLLTIYTVMIACNSTSKVNYTVISTPKEKILKGIINRKTLEADTSFHWFKDNMPLGTTDANAITAFRENKQKFTVLIFGGTWCSDTQNLLPQFYKLVDKSNYPEKHIRLYAVDRDKKTIDNYQENYKITNVPTFIVLHKGKEVGRVVEYGTMNDITKELGTIVSGIHD